MYFKEFLAEIKNDFSRDFESGLIDDTTVYKEVVRGLKRFGNLVREKHDTVVHIENGKGTLPDNFNSLYVALLCEPSCYEVIEDNSNDGVVDSNFYIRRSERETRWNSCDPCCKEEHETVVSETLYVKDRCVKYNYKNPQRLRLGKHINRDACAKDCLNKIKDSTPHEITIKGRTMYANFPSGKVYMIFYGLELDEEGLLIIPDTRMSKVEEYLEYRIKRKIKERNLANNDDPNGVQMLSYFKQEEDRLLGEALTAIKFEGLTTEAFRRYKALNRADFAKVEAMYPRLY